MGRERRFIGKRPVGAEGGTWVVRGILLQELYPTLLTEDAPRRPPAEVSRQKPEWVISDQGVAGLKALT